MKYLDLNIPGTIRFWIRTIARNWYYRLRYVSRSYSLLNETRKLKGSKSGKSAFVFANGPSLKLLDEDKIVKLQKEQGYDVFAVNSYINSPFAQKVIPDYYLLSDPAYFAQDKISEELATRLRKDIQLLVQNKVTVFLPVEYAGRSPYSSTYYFYDAENVFRDNIDILRPRGYLSMTAYKALAAACFMGYDKIYICGFDNDYFLNLVVDENNEIYYIDKHFYDAKGAPEKRVKDVHSKSVGELLYFHHYLFTHLGKFKKFPIINLNTKGIVDCFTKHHTLDVYKDGH